jgi:hypothetical protein
MRRQSAHALALLVAVAALARRAGGERSSDAAQRGARGAPDRAAPGAPGPPAPDDRPHTASDGALKELVGYQEGSKRSVRCAGGGYFTGLELAFNSFSGFSEKVVVGIRLRCST